jgi:hypothetical protein
LGNHDWRTRTNGETLIYPSATLPDRNIYVQVVAYVIDYVFYKLVGIDRQKPEIIGCDSTCAILQTVFLLFFFCFASVDPVFRLAQCCFV